MISRSVQQNEGDRQERIRAAEPFWQTAFLMTVLQSHPVELFQIQYARFIHVPQLLRDVYSGVLKPHS